MAEIKIKKKTPIWPWIVGILIVIALLLYFFVFANDNTDDADDVNTTDTEQVMDNNNGMNDTADLAGISEITSYNSYISDPNMALDHEYTSGALSKLIAATKATADALNVDVNADITEANAKADAITSDPTSLTHANKIKDAAQSIAQALQTIQTEKFPQLKSQYKEVETAISNIDPDTPTLEEKDDVKAFFSKAGNLLTSIQNDHGKEQ